MRFRFTYTNEGGDVQVFDNPAGWSEASIGFMRDPKWWSLTEVFKSTFAAYGSNGTEDGGREWFLQTEKTYGPDGELNVLVEIDPDDSDEYETFYEGQMPIGLFVETLNKDSGHLLQIDFTQADFWTRFKNRYSSQVDIRSATDMDGNAVTPAPKFTLPLPSQVINRKYLGYRDNNAVIPYIESDTYIVFGFDNEQLKEIEAESSLTPMALTNLIDVVPQFNLSEDGILKVNEIKFTLSRSAAGDDANSGGPPPTFTCNTNDKNLEVDSLLDIYLQKNNEPPIPFLKSRRAIPSTFLRNDGLTVTNLYTNVSDYELTNQTLICKKNDAIRIYGKVNFYPLRQDIFVWGRNGWGHDSGSDQTRNAQDGSVDSVGKHALNGYKIAYGGLYNAASNIFPISITDDGGARGILAGDWFNCANDGNLGGVIVSSKNVITAKVNGAGNIIADWNISTITIYEGLEGYAPNNIMDLEFMTTAIDSEADAFLTHDIAAAICDRITGQSGKFYSEYLGNLYTSRMYSETGCGSNTANAKGLHIRGYKLEGDPDPTKNKPYFSSMEDWFQGINPIHALGMGYEKVEVDVLIRCEELGHFMDGSEMSILLSNVFNIKRSYDPDHQFNSAKIGNEKWQSQAATGVGTPSGIDDAQSVRTWNNRFKKIGKQISIMSKWIAASLTLETTRRIGNLLSANYTYDDETFVISLKNNGDGTFQPRLKADGFSSITNLSNADTRYNSDITPARNFLRWLPYLSGALQNYLSSFWKFASGEGNYAMTSTMTTDCPGDDDGIEVAENGDFQVSSAPLFVPMAYEIEHYITWDDYKTLRDKKNKCIGISQSDTGHKKYVIKSLEYFPGKNGTIKLIAWPKTQADVIDIEVIISDNDEELQTSRRFHDDTFENPKFD